MDFSTNKKMIQENQPIGLVSSACRGILQNSAQQGKNLSTQKKTRRSFYFY